MDRITEGNIKTWRRDGYVVVSPFLDEDELELALAAVYRHLPDWEAYSARPEEYRQQLSNGRMILQFPYPEPVLNRITMHPTVLTAVRHLLGTEDIRLTQSMAWCKYAGTFDHEQELHTDFDNNSLVVPRDEGIFQQIPAILYLSDVTLDLGPTYYVKRQFAIRIPLSPRYKSREDYPNLYRNEQPLCVPAGSLLLHSMSGFHRGSRMRVQAGLRLTMHLVYRSAASEWQGWSTWPRLAPQALMHRFLIQATPEERSLLGFPPPGHAYWDEATLDGVEFRYPGIDLQPYRAAWRSR